MSSPWRSYKGDRTLGTIGSEGGTIVREEVYDDTQAVRITLERNAHGVPFAITCGIGGWMVHTRYLPDESSATQAFEAMKPELARIYDLIPYKGTPGAEDALAMIGPELAAFVRRFP